jgi:uncharacterized membrane protein YgdD (TMEM256/DUF423 family)
MKWTCIKTLVNAILFTLGINLFVGTLFILLINQFQQSNRIIVRVQITGVRFSTVFGESKKQS